MHKRTRLHAFVVISCLAFAAQAQTPSAAAAEPIQVAAHKSRWDYPTKITLAPGQVLHVVQTGDTLWDLGAKYLGNPFAWPQIWDLNKWILDPHWIYPGDPLVIDTGRTAIAPGTEAEAAPAEVANLRPMTRRVPKPIQDEYGFSFQDFIQMPYLVSGSAEAFYKKSGAFSTQGRQDGTRGIHADGDTLYLDGGTNQGLKVGDRLVATKVITRAFHHPDDRHRTTPLGDIIQNEGVLRVTHTYPDRSVVIVERALDGIYEGGRALPFTEPPSLLANLRKDVASPITLQAPLAKVIYIREDRTVAAAGDMVIIDQGAKHGLKVGDILITARNRPLESAAPDGKAGKTNFYLGQMMVVRTGESTATCRLLRTTSEVFVGDVATR